MTARLLSLLRAPSVVPCLLRVALFALCLRCNETILALDWEACPGGRSATLAVSTNGKTGFVRLTSAETGIAFTTNDVDADHATLRERGVDVDDEIMRGDDIPSMFWFRDPDGNRYLIVQRGD